MLYSKVTTPTRKPRPAIFPPNSKPSPPCSHLVLYPVPVGPGQVRPKYRDAQLTEVQEAFQFLLATAMHEAGKFALLNVAEVEGRWHYTFSGAGEVFSVVRPEMSKETERQVREMVREILGQEGLL